MTAVRTLVLILACACAGSAPQRPSTTVRGEIDAAEQAERARRHDVARTHYQRAIAIARDRASIVFARREFAETLITWGEYPEATVQLRAITEVAPDDASAWHDLGLLLHNQGDHTRAVASLERARALAPRDPRPRIALAALRWKLGDLDGALVEYRELRELDIPAQMRTRIDEVIRRLTTSLSARRQPVRP
jgi:Flp pilus assembly protein TadD